MSDPRDILIQDYDYDLPPERIAQYPLRGRDAARLLVWKKGQISDNVFSSVYDHLPPRTFLVFNASRVIKSRLVFERENRAPVEVFCLEPAEGQAAGPGSATWQCLVGRLKSWRSGPLVKSAAGISLKVEVVERTGEIVLVRFSWQPPDSSFETILAHFGKMPLPPYISRAAGVDDDIRYQTVYASEGGSVAAPTAGLHFTPELIGDLRKQGIQTGELVLHVGGGTFRPVKSDRLADHNMHGEWFTINAELLQRLLQHGNDPVVAVGTTAMRALESIYWLGAAVAAGKPWLDPAVKQWEPYETETQIPRERAINALLGAMKKKEVTSLTCRTGILIAPPYRARVVNGLITNFHQPRSTLLLLVAAFTGGGWEEIYRHALRNNYRFLSYGDSSLLIP